MSAGLCLYFSSSPVRRDISSTVQYSYTRLLDYSHLFWILIDFLYVVQIQADFTPKAQWVSIWRCVCSGLYDRLNLTKNGREKVNWISDGTNPTDACRWIHKDVFCLFEVRLYSQLGQWIMWVKNVQRFSGWDSSRICVKVTWGRQLEIFSKEHRTQSYLMELKLPEEMPTVTHRHTHIHTHTQKTQTHTGT